MSSFAVSRFPAIVCRFPAIVCRLSAIVCRLSAIVCLIYFISLPVFQTVCIITTNLDHLTTANLSCFACVSPLVISGDTFGKMAFTASPSIP